MNPKIYEPQFKYEFHLHTYGHSSTDNA